MYQQEEATSTPPTGPTSYTAAGVDMPIVGTKPRTARRSKALLAYIRRNRALIFGVAAFALALAGEWFQRIERNSPEPGAWGQAGTVLTWLAVVCVLPVAWVNDAFPRLRWGRRKAVAQPSPDAAIAPESGYIGVPTRRAAGKPSAPVVSTQRPNSLVKQLQSLRHWLGRLGTVGGLAIVIALGATLALVVRGDFTNPFAPYIWLAMLGLLALTFAGVPPRQTIQAMPSDPHEPTTEPPVTRVEWVLVGAIMLAAVLVRFVDLASVPAGPYIDELGRALVARAINVGQPIENLPFSLFGTAWWGVPNLYFWAEAQSLKLFGDTLLGARVIHALAGVGTVWFTYRLGRFAWSPRVGLIAGALVAASDFAIQFSRTAGESTILIFTWTVCFYYLYKGIKRQLPIDFVWSGIAGGLCLYSYASGKLLPLFLILLALFLIVRWGLKGAWRFVPLLALMGLAAGLTFLPHGIFLLNVKQDALTARSNGVAIWVDRNLPGIQAQYATDNLGIIVARQYAVTWSAFDIGQERGPFYRTDNPVLPVPWAALWVLGTAYILFRAGDIRYAGLAVWLLAGLAGAALTNDTPTLQRVAGMVPLLGILPAVFADRMLAGRWISGIRYTPLNNPGRARLLRNAVAIALVLVLAWQATSFYFLEYAPRNTWMNLTLAGRYLENMDPQQNVAYGYNLPTWLGDPSPLTFLAKDVQHKDYDPSEDLPVEVALNQTVHFLTYPAYGPMLSMLQRLYPGGTLKTLPGEDGAPFISAYVVDGDLRAERQHSIAHYGEGDQLVERAEPRLGTLSADSAVDKTFAPPPWLNYPAPVQWSGGIIAPEYGRYAFTIDAPGGASLEIDGKVLLATQANGPATSVEVVLARGTHAVGLSGTLQNAASPIIVRWGTSGTSGQMWPIGQRFLWNGDLGCLLGMAYNTAGEGWLTQPQINTANIPPSNIRRDLFISFNVVNRALHSGTFAFGRWQGTLGIATPGDYIFSPTGDGNISLWLDGTQIAGEGTGGTAPQSPVTVHLEAGQHAIELRFQASRDNATLQLQWQPPGGEMELIPPSALVPPPNGAWAANEMPSAPGLGAALVQP